MQDDIEKERINNEYFEWMYHLVCNDNRYNHLSYRKLFSLLHSIPFRYYEGDRNGEFIHDYPRENDGRDYLRDRVFGAQNGYSYEYVDKYIDAFPCSVLEMIFALAYRIEDQIMEDEEYGNRTSQWFWFMMNSLGLNHMDDNHFDEQQCIDIIERFLDREYDYDGKGGLFTIKSTQKDLRNVDIWTQANWFLNEFENC